VKIQERSGKRLKMHRNKIEKGVKRYKKEVEGR
jgi:hypothetical protein